MGNKYEAWKAKPNCEPIEGTERIILGKSKREVIGYLAYEEGVEHKHNDMIVRCKDGTIWCAHKID